MIFVVMKFISILLAAALAVLPQIMMSNASGEGVGCLPS
jgi:hypothetical protein